MVQESHQPCPRCPSSDAYNFNTVTGQGYCHSCGYGHGDLSKQKGQREDMSSISVSDTYTAVRGVKPATLEFFGAKDLKEGERVVGQMYPYPKGYKMRIHEGKRFSRGLRLARDEGYHAQWPTQSHKPRDTSQRGGSRHSRDHSLGRIVHLHLRCYEYVATCSTRNLVKDNHASDSQ